MAYIHRFFGQGTVDPSIASLAFATITPTARSAMPFACLSRGGVNSSVNPCSDTNSRNASDVLAPSESRRIVLMVDVRTDQWGFFKKRTRSAATNDDALRSLVKTTCLRRDALSVKVSAYLYPLLDGTLWRMRPS